MKGFWMAHFRGTSTPHETQPDLVSVAAVLQGCPVPGDFRVSGLMGVLSILQDSLFTDIGSLVLYGGTHGKVFGFHRLLSKRFPYAICHRVERDSLVVEYRVLDCRREPTFIREALG